MMKNIPLNDARMLGRLILIGFLALGVSPSWAQSGRSAAAGTERHRLRAELAKVPEKARAKSNPLAGDPDAPAAGRKLFEQHCAECHGNTAEGGKRAPSLRSEDAQQATPGAFFWILTNGVVRHGMPTWSKLPEPQRWQVVTFLKSLGDSPRTSVPCIHDQDRKEFHSNRKLRNPNE